MAKKLPKDFVQRSQFDSPFRPTGDRDLAVVEPLPDTEAEESVLGLSAENIAVETAMPQTDIKDESLEGMASSAARKPLKKRAEAAELRYKITARFPKAEWVALQQECHRRRMQGVRMNPSELLREIVDKWMSKSL